MGLKSVGIAINYISLLFGKLDTCNKAANFSNKN